ncbi:hypothetical protein Tco_0854421 [Tanacetum coccineum]
MWARRCRPGMSPGKEFHSSYSVPLITGDMSPGKGLKMKNEDDKDKDEIKGLIWVNKRIDNKKDKNEQVYPGFDSNEEEVVPKVDDVSLVDEVFDRGFGGDGEEDFVMGEGMVVSSSSLDRSTKSCLGGIMVSFIFLERLEEEACMDAIEVEHK